jgi:transcriptional regulator with XRE-family HTH domain
MTDLNVISDALAPPRVRGSYVARVPWNTVVDELAAALGVGMVALIGGVARETVSRWRSGKESKPNASSERRVREAFRIYRDLLEVDSAHTIRAWFMGSNDYLGDESPAESLAHDEIRAVLAAARAFRDE